MTELLLFLVLLVWAVFGIWLAARITRVIHQRVLRILLFLLAAPVLVGLPLADEIIGKFQFDRLCKEGAELELLATLPVGVELYTADGKWRLTITPPLPLNEYNKVRKTLASTVRTESVGPITIPALIPIREYKVRIYDRQQGRLLASYKHYGTRGGWISRGTEKPMIVNDQCFPKGFGAEMMQRILPFRNDKTESK